MNPQKIKVIIAAGGKGTRLFPKPNDPPKPMLKVGDTPVLEHIIEMFKHYDFQQFILTVGPKKKHIIDHFGDGRKFNVSIDYIHEDDSNPLGNAGGVNLARHLIDNTFIVTFGDILRHLDISKLLAFHQSHQQLATLNLYQKPAPLASSQVIFDQAKSITRFNEHPDTTQIKSKFVWESSSFFIFEPEIFDYLSPGIAQDFGKDVIPRLAKSRKAKGFITNDYIIDVGTLERLTKAQKDLESGIFIPYQNRPKF